MKGRTSVPKGILLIVCLALMALMLTGCEIKLPKTRVVEGDWSRGLRVGTANLREAAAIEVDPRDMTTHLLWPQRGSSGIDARYAQVTADGTVAVSRQLETGLFLPHAMRLMVGPGGQVHAFILAGRQSGEPGNIYHMLIDQQGRLVGQPEPKAPANHAVESFDIGATSDHRMVLIWHSSHASDPGTYYRVLDVEARPIEEPLRIAPDGVEPRLAIDGQNTAHLTWVLETGSKDRSIQYAAFANLDVRSTSGQTVARYAAGTGAVFYPPSLTYDQTHVYVLWSVEYRSGVSQGGATTFLVAFPRGQPQLLEATELRLPGSGDLTYSPRATPAAGYTQMLALPPRGADDSSGYIIVGRGPGRDAHEVPVLFAVTTSFRMQEEVQPGMAILSAGRLTGYQLVARSGNFSWNPVLAYNERGDLYALWFDTAGEGNYDAYLATTSPELKAGINRFTTQDILFGIMDAAWGMLSGLTLTPFVVVMLFLPLLWIALVYIFGSEDTLSTRGVRVAFVIAALLYYIGKLIIFSPVIAFPPLRDVVPDRFNAALMYGLPVLVLTLALGALLVYYRRSERPRLLFGFIVFAGVDAVLTMLFYGPGFFA